jgi:DNA primase
VVAAGLVAIGRSAYDRFRGRLLWPIRDSSGDTIGFGARRIFADDKIEAKYLNTPETPIYKKSQVLYGIDLARREMARSSQAVVVEGYTDVMACHLAGVKTAVATCGTSFGDDHARVLRRFLHDHEEFRGEVIFTFDGDAAGQKAALRAFGGDQNFVSQTYVAVEPDGLDPCDLRMPRSANWSPAGCRSTGSCSPTWSPATTSTVPTAASTRSARARDWSPASATGPRSMRSPARSRG